MCNEHPKRGDERKKTTGKIFEWISVFSQIWRKTLMYKPTCPLNPINVHTKIHAQTNCSNTAESQNIKIIFESTEWKTAPQVEKHKNKIISWLLSKISAGQKRVGWCIWNAERKKIVNQEFYIWQDKLSKIKINSSFTSKN